MGQQVKRKRLDLRARRERESARKEDLAVLEFRTAFQHLNLFLLMVIDVRFAATLGRSGVNRRSFLSRDRTILTLFGRSGIDPRVIWDILLSFEYSEHSTGHAEGAASHM